MSALSTAFHVKEELRAETQEPKFWPAAHKSQALYAISQKHLYLSLLVFAKTLVPT